MIYKVADVPALLADVRERSRRALIERLLACVPNDIRSQLLPAVTQHVRGLNDQQLAAQHAILDHQEP